MSQSALIGSLRIHLGLDSAQFSEGLAKSKAGLSQWAKTAKIGAAAVVATMVTAGTAIGIALKGAINDADEMSKAAQKIGVPVEELSKLRYAAELSDVSLEKLGKGLNRLSANMLEVAQGGAGPASRAFAQLGIKVQDATGKLRPVSAVMEDLAGKFAEMPDGTLKTALAMQVFGKAGADLIPLLNSGKAGLAEMYMEAERLGIVLDTQTAQAAERFNDSLTTLHNAQKGITIQLMAGMMPALEQLSAAFVGASKNAVFMSETGKALGGALKVLVTAAVAAGYAIAAVGMTIGAVGQAVGRFVKGDFAGAGRAMSDMDARIKTLGKGADGMVRALWSAPPAMAAIKRGGGGAGEAVEKLGKSAGKTAKATKELTEAEREAARAAEELKREGDRVFDSTRTSSERLEATTQNLIRLFHAGKITGDTYKRAMREARLAAEKVSQDPLGDLIEESLGEQRKVDAEAKKRTDEEAEDRKQKLYDATFDGIEGGLYAAADGDLGEYLAGALKRKLFEGLAASIADMILGKGGPGWLKAAGAVIGGLPGFKTGGSFKVGGSGGVDSKLMAFKATPGEMVDIRRPGQERDSGGATEVIVTPSPYFDVQVRKVAAPMAHGAGTMAVEQARREAPAAVARAQRLGTY